MIDAVHLLQSVLQTSYSLPATLSFNFLPDWCFQSLLFRHAASSPLSCLSLSVAAAKSARNPRQLRLALTEAESAVSKLRQLLFFDPSTAQKWRCYDHVQLVIHWFTVGQQRIELLWDAASQCSQMTGNPYYFEQLLEILISNGCEAQRDEGLIVVKGKVSNNWIDIIIQDYGCGMGPVEQKLCQLVGYSQKKDGMGVGLACARRLAHQLGGYLQLRSWQGIGTQIICRLPLDRAAHSQIP